MNFELTEETAAMQEVTHKFAAREILPGLREDGFNRELVRKMGEVGLFGCAFPPAFGGADSGFLAHSVVCEEISRADSGLRSYLTPSWSGVARRPGQNMLRICFQRKRSDVHAFPSPTWGPIYPLRRPAFRTGAIIF